MASQNARLNDQTLVLHGKHLITLAGHLSRHLFFFTIMEVDKMKDKNITVGSVWHDIMGCNIRNVIVADITNTDNEILISYKDKSGLTDMTFKRSKESFLMNFGRGEIDPIIFFVPRLDINIDEH